MLDIATPEHLDAVFKLLQVKRREERAFAPVNDAKVRGAISEHIADKSCLIGMQGDQIVASAAMYFDAPWDSDQRIIIARWFYIHPKHRKEGHASRLLAAMKATAQASHVPLLVSVGPMKLCELEYFKRRLRLCGGSFIFNPAREAA